MVESLGNGRRRANQLQRELEIERDLPGRKRRRFIDYPRRGRRGVRHWIPSWRLILGSFVVLAGLLVGGFFVALHNVVIPQPNDFAVAQATIFEYADGKTQIAHVGVNRVSVPLSQIPLDMQHALLAAEDRSFYTEPPVSVTGIMRAAKNNLTSSGSNLQGGSTITQQYVKNYYLTEKQTASRKLDEILVAIKIDGQLSKDQILQNYLNTIYFARGAYGIETASRAYFGEPVSALAGDPAKAAYLASLVQQPYYFATAATDPKAAKALRARWNYVLNGMVEQGWLSKSVRDSLTFPTPLAYQPNDLAGMNGYMVNAATQYLDKLHDQDPDVPDSTMISRGGYTIVTTFQQSDMQAAQQAVRENLSTLNPGGNPADQNVHAGLAAIDTTTGAVLGFYGGPNYLKQGFDDALQAAGPIGSDVSIALADGVSAAPRQNWPDAINALGQLGVSDSNAKDVPPSDDDFTSTPLHAAGAFMLASNGGVYHQPYEVSEVLYQGKVIWQAAPSTASFVGNDKALRQNGPLASGIDGSAQWAWSLADIDRVSVAVDLYATKPNGVTNRPLSGMTPMPDGETGPNAPATPVSRAKAITMGFMARTVIHKPGLSSGRPTEASPAKPGQ
ncbi:MAG TPA: transglycosylase domain-containing protein [Pseudonocardiaceae bacterium]|nr:transglycosylase domain-containing protein [Pseudonocardiaceae bacterium]